MTRSRGERCGRYALILHALNLSQASPYEISQHRNHPELFGLFFLKSEYSMVLLCHDQEREEQHAEYFVIRYGLVVVLQVFSLAPSVV